MSIKLDGDTFAKRIELIANAWNKTDSTLSKVSSVLVAVGNPNEQTTFQKSSVLHSWLLGYEFTDTLILLTKDGKVAFLTSQKKCTILESLAPAFPLSRMVFLRKAKDGSNVTELFNKLSSLITTSGASLGVLEGEKIDGPTVNEWNKFFAQTPSLSGMTKINVVDEFSRLLSCKDSSEFQLLQNAGTSVCSLMRNILVEELLSVIDQERKVSHAKIAEKIEKFIASEVRGDTNKWKLPNDVKKDFIDICYSPLVESGGKYSLIPSNASTAETLHFGTIACFLGLRYRSYCANVARTFLIEPTKEQEDNYAVLLKLSQYLHSKLQNGITLGALYDAGAAWIQQNHPSLCTYLPSSFGHGIGIEFKESSSSISSGNQTTVKPGMAFNLVVSFNNIKSSNAKDENSKSYSLVIADTVGLDQEGSFVCFTDAVPKAFSDISYFFKDEESEEDEDEESEEESYKSSSRSRASRTRSSRYSSKDLIENEKAQRKRKEHQIELAERNVQAMLDKYSKNSKSSQASAVKPSSSSSLLQFESYKKDVFIPKETKEVKIYVDKRNDTLIFPIMGLAVPFHISTLKNASKSDEGEYTYLRINFNNPTQKESSLAASTDSVQNVDANPLSFIRSLTFRSSESSRLANVLKDINELRRLFSTREVEKKDLAELVKQENLVEIKGRRPHRITDVHLRPSMEGKRVPGEVEIHSNGIRYKNQLKSDQRVDILFDNIKHLFFQPCDDEMIAAVHCHLKNYIMIGKKRTKDVQFYREALDASADETSAGSSRSFGARRKVAYGDEDEIMQEQEDRKRRNRLNEEFKSFAEKIAEQSNYAIEVDLPIRELGFFGVPGRQNVFLMPTKECLVHLTDPPFTVATLNEVEFASFERIVFSVKNFDLSLIFKDHKQSPLIITSIPAENLEPLKDWLDSMDILYAESKINLNWTNIMKAVNDDPVGFYESGGWDFLKTEGVESEEEEEEDDGDEVYSEEEDEEEEESEVSEEEEEEEESEFTEDESEDDEDAPDWEELEEEAEREDQRARLKQATQQQQPAKRRRF